MPLPNSGSCSYNGVPWTQMYKSKVEVKPVRDSAGRALVAREYTIDIEGYIAATPGGTTDGQLVTMRQQLERPAGALNFANKGFGVLQVNVPGGQVWDAEYGPWPDVLSWQPVGNDQGCLVRWRCVTKVPCEENPRPKGIIEWCWSETWDIDDDGYTRRTIEGHLTVEATRATVNSRAVPDNADAYRDKVVPELPEGYRRRQNFQLSEDKRTLRFRIDDEQMPAPLPDGVSRADVRQRVHWGLRAGAALIRNTISGTLTFPPGTAKTDAWWTILLILNSRLRGERVTAAARASQPAMLKLLGKTADNAGLLLIEDVEVDDELFGRSTSFSVTATAYGVTLDQLLTGSGLFDKVSGTFGRWKTSMARGAFSSRGVAGLGFQNGDDAIVDLCGRQDPPALKARTAYGVPRSLRGGLPRGPNGADPVPPEKSWIY